RAGTADAGPVGATVRAVLTVVTGAADAAPNTSAQALADRVLRDLFLTRVRRVTAAVLAAVLLAGGVGVLAQQVAPRPVPENARRPGPVEPAAEALPPGAVARLGTTRLRHGGEVLSVALSPDDKVVASAGGDGVVRLWDTRTGTELRRFEHADGFTAAAFLDGGKTLVGADGAGSLHVWDATTGKELRSWKVLTGRVEEIAPSVDGRSFLTLGGQPDYPVHLW